MAADEGQSIRDQQAQIAQFRQNLPQLQGQMRNYNAGQAASEISGAQKNIDTSYNQRGLLYSGMNQGAKAGAAAQGAGQLAQQNYNTNTGLQNLSDQYATQGINTGLDNYKGLLSFQEGQYANSLQQQSQNRQMLGGLFGGAAQVGGLALLASDENLKDNVESGEREVTEMLDSVEPKKFDYKDEKFGEGKQIGLLAQDLEKSSVGKMMVQETPDGKMVDFSKGFAAILAAQSMIHRRLKEIEEKRAS